MDEDLQPQLGSDERDILRLLVARYEANSFGLAYLRLDDLMAETGFERKQVIVLCDRLIDQGLAETEGALMRAIMPEARAALVIRSARRRPSTLA